MTRTLLLIAGVGFVVAVVCFGGMAALGGRDLAAHGWTWHGGRITIDNDFKVGDAGRSDGGGPAETREIAWNGGESLEFDLPADVQFTQAAGPGKVTITGPKGTVDRITLSGSHLGFEDEPSNAQRVTVVMTAPNVRHFSIEGDGSIAIAGFNQDDLDLEISGDGRIKAEGHARAVKLDISGDGDADLGRLATERAQVEIEGSGRTTIAPTSSADLNISGDGEIDLVSRPASMHSDVSGSGRIVQTAPSAPASGTKPS